MASREEVIVAGQVWESPTITVDGRGFPLVVTRYRGAVTHADFERHLRVMSSSMRIGQKTAVILDTTEGAARSAESMKALRDWLDRERELMRTQVIGLALVIPSAAVRFLLTKMMLVVDMPYPYEVVDSYTAGLAYARKQLALMA